MKSFLWFSAVVAAIAIGNQATAQEFSFRSIDRMANYEKDLLKVAIEQGQITRTNAAAYRDIDLDGIEYGGEDDIALFIALIVQDVCPTCSTTSSGSTVRVSYGGSSGDGKDAYVLNASDYYAADAVEENCNELLSDHAYERDGKDIVIVDNNDDDDKIALCFDRD